MPENVFKTAEDLSDYFVRLRDYHSARIRTHMQCQAMWEQAIRTSDTGRTVYINNEPWTATRLIQNLIDNGKVRAEACFLPDDAKSLAEVSEQKQMVEHVVDCILTQTDERLHDRRRDSLKREMSWDMAVLGWYAGIALVLDNVKGSDPFFIDNWSPTDTFPEMEGSTALVHRSRMTKREIERTFGKNRKGGKLPGYNAKFEDDSDTLKYDVYDYWDDETNATAMVAGSSVYWLKKPTPHKLGHNPTWCNPVNAVPARYSATDRNGNSLDAPDGETNKWLSFVGQTPMLGYLPIYRNITEAVNQIQDVIEKWADVKIVIVTEDGKFREVDMSRTDGSPAAQLKVGERLDIVAPPTFPADMQAYLKFLLGELQKASFPQEMYGANGAGGNAASLALLQQTSGYIVGPIGEEVRKCYHKFINNLIRQLETRGKQYSSALPMLSQDKKGKPFYSYITLSDIPKGTKVAIELKGAGVRPDKLGMLATTNQIANSPSPILDDETLIDDYLELEDAPAILQKKLEQKLTTHPEVIGAMAPIMTALEFHKSFKRKAEAGNEIAVVLSDMALAVAKAGVMKLQELVAPKAPVDPAAQMQSALQGAAGGGGGAAPPLDGSSQTDGVAAPGAPPAGVPQPTTGPDMGRGAEMAQAQMNTPPPQY